MAKRHLVLPMLALSGCYAELGAGYYPILHDSETSTNTKTSGYVAMAKLGFYLDVPIASQRMSIGAGFSPGVGGEGINPSGSSKVGVQGYDTRLDVALPYFVSVLQPRITVAYLHAADAGVKTMETPTTKGSGHTVFLGASIGGTTSGTLALLSVGLQFQNVTTQTTASAMPFDISGYGVAARVMVTWTPTGAFLANYTPSTPSKQCGYGTPVCDARGHCESHYFCN